LVPNGIPQDTINTCASINSCMEQMRYSSRLLKLLDGTLECNRQYFRAVVDALTIKGNNPQTIEYYLFGLHLFARNFKDTDLASLSQCEIAKGLSSIKDLHYSDHTVRHAKRSVKQFYTRLRGAPFASFIKLGNVQSTLRRSDLITRGELTDILNGAHTLRDRAIFALLYDGALRRGELLALRIKDFDFGGDIVHVTLNGKTGVRTIPLTFSVPYLKAYLDATPRLTNEARLLDIGEPGLRMVMRRTTDRRDLGKRLYPQLFRTSRLTELAAIWPEQLVKKFAGWTPDSPMPLVYVHLNTADLDRAVMAPLIAHIN